MAAGPRPEAGSNQACQGKREQKMSQPVLKEPDSKDFEEMERYDELQVVEEVKGHITLPKFFYELKIGTVGISWIGIKALASYMSKNGAPISIVKVEREETEDAYRFMVTARLLSTGEDRIGISEQAKMMKLSDGREVKDPFALQKALSKAQRNALRIFIPESAIEESYQRWKTGGSVEPRTLTIPASQERQPTDRKQEICTCGHQRNDHIPEGNTGRIYCTACIKAGKANVKCDLLP